MRSTAIPEPGPSHRGTALGFALAAIAVHLPALTQYGWFRDEFYYVACARHLAWGYVDQPPLSVAVLALVRAVAGESLVALRLTAALIAAAGVYLTARLARELGGGRFAQALAALAALVTPIYLAVGRFYSMNVLDLLLWTLAALSLVAVLRHGRPRDWAWLGIVTGLGLLNKISMLWFGFGLLVGLVLTSHRRHLATPWPYAAGAIAAAFFLPHVVWQVSNGWPTLEFMRNATGEKMVAVSPLDFVAGQLQVMGPGNALIYLPGLVFALVSPAARAWRIFPVMFLVVAALLIGAGSSRANYLAVAYPPLFALGAIAWEHWSTRAPQVARGALVAVVLLLGVLYAPLALPILPVEGFIRYQAALGMQPSTEERKSVGPLPQHYADMFGWEDLVAEVARASERLTPGERAHAVVFGQNYGEAGAVDVLGRPRGLPPAISGHNNYWLWGPGLWDGAVMILIGGEPEDHAAHFEEVERVGTWDHPYAMPYERNQGIYVARRFKGDPREVWQAVKHYD